MQASLTTFPRLHRLKKVRVLDEVQIVLDRFMRQAIHQGSSSLLVGDVRLVVAQASVHSSATAAVHLWTQLRIVQFSLQGGYSVVCGFVAVLLS